jgi:hypothetical protein
LRQPGALIQSKIMNIPRHFLIAVLGSIQREYSAMNYAFTAAAAGAPRLGMLWLVIAFGCAPGWLLGKVSLVSNMSVSQL